MSRDNAYLRDILNAAQAIRRVVAGMRDVLIHDYDKVNLNVVWDAAMDSLPPLIAQLESYLAAHPPPGSSGPQADV